MRLPSELRSAIDEYLGTQDARALARSAAALTARYRKADFAQAAMRTGADRAAYLAVRMPATFAAVSEVLSQACSLAPEFAPHSLLDLGAGPATAAWAAATHFASLERILCVERDAQLALAGRTLMQPSENEALRTAEWHTTSLNDALPGGQFDLIVLSYSLGELGSGAASVLHRAWQCCSGWLLVIEPGTKAGFANILRARGALLQSGAHLLAPCPHEVPCPMLTANGKPDTQQPPATQGGDWCHFSVRLERTGEHRRLKLGELGYEDEKFSYLVASRAECTPAVSRIVRHPMRYAGYAQLELCTNGGLARKTVTRSHKEDWRRLKKSDWGDAWEQPSERTQ